MMSSLASGKDPYLWMLRVDKRWNSDGNVVQLRFMEPLGQKFLYSGGDVTTHMKKAGRQVDSPIITHKSRTGSRW